MALSLEVLIACYIIVVNGDGDINVSNSGLIRTRQTDDIILPEIQILVKTFPKDVEKYNVDNIHRQSSLNEENSLNLPLEIKSQIIEEHLAGGVFTSTSDLIIEQVNNNINSGSTDGMFGKSDSYLTTPVKEISSIANMAWDDITQVEDITDIIGEQQNQSNLEITDHFQDRTITDGRSDIQSNNSDSVNTKVDPVILQTSEEHEFYTPKYHVERNNIHVERNNIHIESNNIHTDDTPNNIDIMNDDSKSHTESSVDKSLKQRRTKKKDINNKDSITKPFSGSHKFTKHTHSNFGTELGHSKTHKMSNTSSKKKKVLKSDDDQLSDDEETHKESDVYNDGNTVTANSESGMSETTTSWYGFNWLSWFPIDHETTESRNLLQVDGPEPPDADDNVDIASAVSGFDNKVGEHDSTRQNSRLSYGSGISSSSFRAEAEADLKTSDVTKLIEHYGTCETCMITVYNTSHQCPYYNDQASEFDKWARTFSDFLKYGCEGQGVQHTERCCHFPDEFVQTAAQEISKVTKSIANVMRKQCEKCPVDCIWSEWEHWSSCPVTCGSTGFRNRSRIQKHQKYQGQPCPGQYTQREVCPEPNTEYGSWQTWSSWSSCSSTCGGTRHRTRKCSEPTTCSCFVPCDNSNVDLEVCGDGDHCCYSRTWSTWGAWEDCVTVDIRTMNRQKTRWRSCDADEKYIDKPMCPQPCPGFELQNEPCCRFSVWGEWGGWSECIGTDYLVDLETGKQCGTGCKNRTRICVSGTCPNDTCYGDVIERIYCNLDPCCAPPAWTTWSMWSACSVSAGTGLRSRARSCQSDPDKWRSPVCKFGGCFDREDSKESEACSGACPHCVPPTWGTWESWSECSFSQSRYRRTSRRDCVSISSWDPGCRHLQCHGNHDVREEECHCDDPEWTSWSHWSLCDYTPVGSLRKRNRVCLPASNPSYCKDTPCAGASEQRNACCRDQTWLSWGAWSACDYTSYRPTRIRTRSCSSPDPGCSNAGCGDTFTDSMSCPPLNPTTTNEPLCDPGQWGGWGQWGSCDCNNSKLRSRTRDKTSDGWLRKRKLCPFEKDIDYEICQNQCGECTDTCNGRPDGRYPSCKRGCTNYVACCQGQPTLEKCSDGQQYDSVCQTCRKPPSPTCSADLYDKHRGNLILPVKKAEQCTDLQTHG